MRSSSRRLARLSDDEFERTCTAIANPRIAVSTPMSTPARMRTRRPGTLAAGVTVDASSTSATPSTSAAPSTGATASLPAAASTDAPSGPSPSTLRVLLDTRTVNPLHVALTFTRRIRCVPAAIVVGVLGHARNTCLLIAAALPKMRMPSTTTTAVDN